MEKIQSFPLSQLPNSQHFQLATDFGVEATRFGISELGLTAYFPAFTAAKDTEAAAIKVDQGSATTELIFDEDVQRDRTFWGISTRIDSSLLSPVAAEVASAKILKRIMEKYGDVRNHEYNAESAELNLLLSDLLLPANAPHVQTLGLTAWVATLKTQNDLFQVNYNKRDNENSTRSSGNTRAARKAVDASYRIMIDVINASVVLNLAKPTALLFIKEWNLKLDRYRTLLTSNHNTTPDNTPPKA